MQPLLPPFMRVHKASEWEAREGASGRGGRPREPSGQGQQRGGAAPSADRLINQTARGRGGHLAPPPPTRSPGAQRLRADSAGPRGSEQLDFHLEERSRVCVPVRFVFHKVKILAVEPLPQYTVTQGPRHRPLPALAPARTGWGGTRPTPEDPGPGVGGPQLCSPYVPAFAGKPPRTRSSPQPSQTRSKRGLRASDINCHRGTARL